MKRHLLLASAASAALATLIASIGVLGADPAHMARILSVASFIGLLSVGLFFVGLVFPKDQ